MKYAIIAVTHNGVKFAHRIQQELTHVQIDIYAKKDRYNKVQYPHVSEYTIMRDLVDNVFSQYDALIFFTSTGIAVRMIAPHIVHKVKDPAVVVLDEQANFAISLLSGHLGGGNELTEQIAGTLGAIPVITTATDVNNLLAPDIIARKLGLVPYPLEHIKTINAAMLHGDKIQYYIDASWRHADYYRLKLEQWGIKAQSISMFQLAALMQSATILPSVFLSSARITVPNMLVLTPRQLIVGLGCRRGTSSAEINIAINQAVKQADCEHLQIANLVSTTVKADEIGILEWAKEQGVQTHFYDNAILEEKIAKFKLQESDFVKATLGIGNVCEASILAYNERAKIILPKTKFEKVTVSLAWE